MAQFCYSWLHLGIETVYCRLLQRIDGKDGRGLKAKPARNANKKHQKIIIVTIPWQNVLMPYL